jgi:hypothetical protein
MFSSSPFLAASLALLAFARGTPLFAGEAVTFSRDVAPLLQQKCQVCHRPGTNAPMSLLTYAETRPWARAIKQRVVSREMPPWPLTASSGGRRFKNDRSLTETEIQLLVRWVDAGAPPGDAGDLPPPVSWPDGDVWQTGTPDLIVSLPPRSIAATGPDAWTDFVIDTGLAEDRYIRAVETKPSAAGRGVVHHVVTHLVQNGSDDAYLSEYAVGKESERFPADTGRLIKAGAKVRVNVHDHPAGRALVDRMEIGLFLYPRGTIPKHHVIALTIGLLLLDDALDIPANSIVTHHASARLPRTVRIISFQPHMHTRGKAMTLEAVRADGTRELLGAVDRYDFGVQTAYIYEDDASPVLPAGTVLHAVATFDNTTANRRNPDPNQWVGFGNRMIDEMFQCHVLLVEIDDTERQPSSAGMPDATTPVAAAGSPDAANEFGHPVVWSSNH